MRSKIIIISCSSESELLLNLIITPIKIYKWLLVINDCIVVLLQQRRDEEAEGRLTHLRIEGYVQGQILKAIIVLRVVLLRLMLFLWILLYQ